MKEHVETLDLLASVKSRSEKIAVLKQKLQNDEFRTIVRYALNPFITFGIKDYEIAPHENPDILDPLFIFLDKLAGRQITGRAARLMAGSYVLADDNFERILEVVLNKDLKCGIGARTINTVWPDLIPEFPICLAEDYRAEIADFPMYETPKIDGMRGLALCFSPTEVSLRSRDGHELGPLTEVREHIARYYERVNTPFMLDGELYAGNLANTISQVSRKTEPTDLVTYNVFDYLPLDVFMARMISRLTLEERIMALDHMLQVQTDVVRMVPHTVVFSIEEALAAHQRNLANGYEGTVYRQPQSLYDYRRSHAWQRLKPRHTVDLPVVGMVEGTGRLKDTVGALIVDYKGKHVNVFGIPDELRRAFWRVLPGVIEVEYQNVTPNGSLRHATFVRVRNDKE